MRPLLNIVRALRRDNRGATAVEYGLIVGLIVVALIASIIALANVTTGMWNDVSTKVTTAS